MLLCRTGCAKSRNRLLEEEDADMVLLDRCSCRSVMVLWNANAVCEWTKGIGFEAVAIRETPKESPLPSLFCQGP